MNWWTIYEMLLPSPWETSQSLALDLWPQGEMLYYSVFCRHSIQTILLNIGHIQKEDKMNSPKTSGKHLIALLQVSLLRSIRTVICFCSKNSLIAITLLAKNAIFHTKTRGAVYFVKCTSDNKWCKLQNTRTPSPPSWRVRMWWNMTGEALNWALVKVAIFILYFLIGNLQKKLK